MAEFLFRLNAKAMVGLDLDFGFERADIHRVAPRGQLFAFRPARSAKPEVLHYERIVVLLFAFLVRPVIRTDLGLNNELIALEGIFSDCLAETLERDEP